MGIWLVVTKDQQREKTEHSENLKMLNYELWLDQMKKADPSGMGMILLMGDSEAILRVLSVSSSSGSNWPSSSSAQANTATANKIEKKEKEKKL